MAKLPKESSPIGMSEQEVEERKPAVYLQVPFDQAKDIDIGDTVTVKFRGKVIGTSMSKRKKARSHAELDVEDPDISVDSSSGKIESLDEDFDI